MVTSNARHPKLFAKSLLVFCFILYQSGASIRLCYNEFMYVEDIKNVVAALLQRLEPVERAELLTDTVEGKHPHARKAAVLIGLFDQEGEASLVFIRRASTLRSHGGEIAFPGGGIELVDRSPAAAALREAQEEIGLDTTGAEVLGVLEPVFTVVSNYLIMPVVAFLPKGLGMIQLQASEVTEVILIPLRSLTDEAIYHTEEWTRDGLTRTMYFYDYGHYRIWGVTARILKTFLDLLKQGS